MYGGSFNTNGLFHFTPTAYINDISGNSMYDNSGVYILVYDSINRRILYSNAYNDLLYRIDVVYKYLHQQDPSGINYPSGNGPAH
jgi:hypothetical protein